MITRKYKMHLQFYVVTGGYDGSFNSASTLSSTEILAGYSSQWEEAGSLPSPRIWLSSISVGNNIFVTGTK